MSSCFCSEWSFWLFLSKISKMSIMLIMLIVITSDLNDQSDHFKTLITQWLFNHCCYVILCERVLTSLRRILTNVHCKLIKASVLFSLDMLVTLLSSLKIHVCMNKTNETQIFFTIFQFSVTYLNKAYEIWLKLLSSSWILLCWHSIIHCFNLVLFI